MANDRTPPPRGLSLYANLLDSSAASSAANVAANKQDIQEDEAAKKQQASLAGTLRRKDLSV